MLNLNEILDTVVIAPDKPVPVKMLLLVDSGRKATLRVAADQRDEASLLYGRTSDPGVAGYDLGDGSPAVRLTACKSKGGPTQFNGGPLVTHRGCFAFEVESRGKTSTLVLPIGVPDC